MILKLVEYPNEVLTTPAEPVPKEDIKAPDIQRLIDDMIETAEDLGALGLAAPQVGRSLAIAIFRTSEDPEWKVLINPGMKVVGNKVYSYGEGCLSSPEKRFDIKRYKKVLVRYEDREGNTSTLKSRSKMEAFVIQHEIHHLSGKVLAEYGKER